MRVAVTGASGFVGKAVVPRLVAAGHMVRALYRAPASAHLQGVAVVTGDLSSRTALEELVGGADVVLHIAGAVHAKDALGFHAVNAEGTARLATAAISRGVKRFVHVSSLAARRPEISDYAASKRAGEDRLLALKGDMATLILRPAAVYGPGDVATLPLLQQLMAPLAILPGKATARFSLVHVDDFADVCVDAVAVGATGVVDVDDLSGGYDWADLVRVTRAQFGRPGKTVFLPQSLASGLGLASETIARFTGRSAMLTRGKVREMYQDTWLAEAPNWPRQKPIALADGLPQTIRWHQQRGTLPKGNPQPAA